MVTSKHIGCVFLKEVAEKHESLTASHISKSGFLSSGTSDSRDYSLVNKVTGSTVSGDTVTISSGADLLVRGSNVVGTHDVKLSALENVNILSAQETGNAEQYRYEKTSGLFSGGGLGFTIGSRSEKITTTEKTLGQVGSTVGSLSGSVSILAGSQISSAGTTFVAV